MSKKTKHGKHSAESQHGLDVVIETPKGSRNKFKFDEKDGNFRLSKVLPEGMMFPYDFGFVPGTRGEDGDPLDVLVLMDEPTFPGCVVECVLVGVVEAEQEEEGSATRNDRLIAVANASQTYAGVRELADLNPAVVRQIEGFFVNYQAPRDVRVTILDRKGAAAARKIVSRSYGKKAA